MWPSIIISTIMMCIMPRCNRMYVLWKNSTYFTNRFISTQNIKCKKMSGQNVAWNLEFRILETVWRKSVVMKNISSINVSLIKDLKSSLTSLKRWENANKSSLQKICICNLSSNTNLASVVSITYFHLFSQSRQKKRRNWGKRTYYKKTFI